MVPIESDLESQSESLNESQLDSIDKPSASSDADMDANATVDLALAPIRRDDFYTGYQAILLGRAGPPPTPELAPSIDNLRDTKFVGPAGCRHPISAV
jgi:hypothetical protein